MDTDRMHPKRALVQAIVVDLHEPTGWGGATPNSASSEAMDLPLGTPASVSRP